MMRVLALCSYPVESAATRHRIMQFVEPLRERGVEIEVSPFLSSEAFADFYSGGGGLRRLAHVASGIIKRLREVVTAGRYDAVFIQREAMFFGPGVFEWLLSAARGLPMVLDLDDATYIPYVSPTYGRIGSALKFFRKTDRLIERAAVVLCGNSFIAEYVESKGSRAVVVPTTVDPQIFKPKEKGDRRPVLGWIGTHSTFPLLESIFPVLTELSKKHEFILRIVGSGRDEVNVAGVEVENVRWELAVEPDSFASLDIGLYPVTTSASASEEWLKGKSGFKAIQYLAVGIPFVMTPVGVCAEIGREGETHFNAESQNEWAEALDVLLSDRRLRESMGSAGRIEFMNAFHPCQNIESLASVFLSLK